MASLREIKDHIGSVQSTLKITSAMKLVSSAKLRKAQQAVETMRPYQQELERILAAVNSLSDSALQDVLSSDSGKGLSAKRWESDTYLLNSKLAIVAIASNSSLCGAFNGNVLRKVSELVTQAGGPDSVDVFALGRKVGGTDWNHLVAHPDYAASQQLSSALVEAYNAGRYSSVMLVYNHFVSTSSQKVVVESFLPLSYAGSEDSPGYYIIEPGREAILEELLPQVIRLKLYAAILDSVAAEHAARMIAMQAATDNAEDLLAELSLEYNKGRQA